MNILLAGDTHGDLHACKILIKTAAEHDADLFVLGDFGYWEHTFAGEVFLDQLSEAAHKAGVVIRWLDGNHENHPMLWSKYGVAKDVPVKVRPSIYYHGRGLRWTWCGVQFMSLGGAASVDKPRRELWRSWWPTELIHDTDVSFSIRSGKVDVLFCHDAPNGLNHVLDIAMGGNFKFDHAASNLNRDLLQRVINIKTPRMIIHGHMHVNHNTEMDMPWGSVKVIGLENCDTYLNPHALRGARLMTIDDSTGEIRV